MKRLFQLDTNVNMPCTANAGLSIGVTMVLNVLNSPQPSIRAASTISSGSDEAMYWIMKKYTAGAATAGTISGM